MLLHISVPLLVKPEHRLWDQNTLDLHPCSTNFLELLLSTMLDIEKGGQYVLVLPYVKQYSKEWEMCFLWEQIDLFL